jgi:hypothetical protein
VAEHIAFARDVSADLEVDNIVDGSVERAGVGGPFSRNLTVSYRKGGMICKWRGKTTHSTKEGQRLYIRYNAMGLVPLVERHREACGRWR